MVGCKQGIDRGCTAARAALQGTQCICAPAPPTPVAHLGPPTLVCGTRIEDQGGRRAQQIAKATKTRARGSGEAVLIAGASASVSGCVARACCLARLQVRGQSWCGARRPPAPLGGSTGTSSQSLSVPAGRGAAC